MAVQASSAAQQHALQSSQQLCLGIQAQLSVVGSGVDGCGMLAVPALAPASAGHWRGRHPGALGCFEGSADQQRQ